MARKRARRRHVALTRVRAQALQGQILRHSNLQLTHREPLLPGRKVAGNRELGPCDLESRLAVHDYSGCADKVSALAAMFNGLPTTGP